MKKKKILITSLALSVGFVFAKDFIVIIDKKSSNYIKKIENTTETVEYTGWVDEGSVYNCNLTPLTEDYYEGLSFNQKSDCSQDQKQTKNTYEENLDTGTKTLLHSEEMNQTVSVSTTQQEVGTYKAISCLDAKNHNASVDGLYTIQLSGNTESVYCDMSNGGWTLLMSTGSDLDLSNLTSENRNKNNPPTTINHTLYDYMPKMSDFFVVMDQNTIFKFDCKDKEYGTEREYFHRNITDYNNYFNMSTGTYSGTMECATNESFSENYQNDISCIGGNDTEHRYYRAGLEEYGWALYSGISEPKSLRHCGSNWIGDAAGNQSQGYIWFK